MNGTQRQLLGEVNKDKYSGPYTYLHRAVTSAGQYTYTVVAVGSQDRESPGVSVTVR
jgi:hypothetical protein